MATELIFGAIALGVLAIASCTQRREETVVLSPVETPYADKYAFAVPDETPANKLALQVEDDVPNSGRVVMRCEGDGRFEYWADRAVSFAHLQTLARKWVLVFSRLTAFNTRPVEAEAPAKTVPADEVFAKFKNYQPKKPSLLGDQRTNVFRSRGRLLDLEAPANPPPERAVSYSEFKKNN
jgi:hypothetical protein